MKWYWYVACVIGLIMGVELIPDIANNKVSDDEIWWEKYQLDDGSYIRVIHAHDCRAKKPLIAWNVQCDMIEYYKEIIDVYDYCIDEDDAAMLNSISRRNTKNALERQWAYAEEDDYESCRHNEMMWDTSMRTRNVAFSMKDGNLVRQNDDGRIILNYSCEIDFGK